MPKVSVIMGVYNLPDQTVLQMSIGSIIQQSFQDWELIICEDGSTDNTYEVLQQVAKQDNRIKLIRNTKNLKASGARNKCIYYAKGKYIAIMDADDSSHPLRLEKQVAYLDSNPEISFVGTKGKFFEENLGDDNGEYWFCKAPTKEDFLWTLPFVHASIMFRRNVLQATEGYSEARWIVRSEDYDMLMRMYEKGFKGANLGLPLYYIRIDQSTYTRRKYRYRINEMIVKCIGYKKLGLMPKGIIFAIKPLVVGLIPVVFLNKLKSRYYSEKDEK